jgi:hypothetical protein
MTLPELELPPPLDGKAHRVSMGLRPLDLDEWILTDRHRDTELLLKDRLLRERHDDVFAALPESEAAGAEVLALVVDAVTSGEGAPVLIDTTGTTARDIATGIVVDLREQHPLDAAARLVQEDLCVMERRGDTWVLAAASVCFPSRWRLAEKIGRSMADIHEPVAGYERIRTAADLSLDKLTVERPVIRSNWTLIDDPTLFQPRPEGRKGAGVDLGDYRDGDPEVLEHVHLRVERQTLRALPATGAVLFTIRTRVHPVASFPAIVLGRLAETLATVDRDTVEYKGWSKLLPKVQAALSNVLNV